MESKKGALWFYPMTIGGEAQTQPSSVLLIKKFIEMVTTLKMKALG